MIRERKSWRGSKTSKKSERQREVGQEDTDTEGNLKYTTTYMEEQTPDNYREGQIERQRGMHF